MAENNDVRRGRGRPRGGSILDPDDIVTAALQALQRGGWSAMTMRGVARECRVSLASVQHHFPTKQDLWKACIQRLTGGPDADLGKQPPIGEVFRMMIERNAAAPGLFAAVLGDNSPGHEERLAHLAEQTEGRLAASRAFLDGAGDVGLLRDIDRDALLALIVLGIGSLGSSKVAARHFFGVDLDDAEDRQRLADGLTDIVLFGIVTRDAPSSSDTADAEADSAA